ncbi:DUF7344 domain-containing protein [Haladaptatus caseinilyticus]|uniref:DUF7344 domain-containing protein n=1 Tax=Haladaptatus caseinilyticus TaxID=2993314 RepID=UPI00224B3AA6|nr:hypothetical protein [Haladaptatus caseinilyticus]
MMDNTDKPERTDEANPYGGAYDLLKHPHRRAVIAQLEGRESSTTISKLCDELLVTEYNGEATERDRRRIELELYHIHLPMLADHGVVEFDTETDVVAPKSIPDVGWLDSSIAESGGLSGGSD